MQLSVLVNIILITFLQCRVQYCRRERGGVKELWRELDRQLQYKEQ